MFQNRFKAKSTSVTLPKSKKVHGIPVTKATVAKYIQSMDKIQALPQTILETCFPDTQFSDLIQRARTADSAFLSDLVVSLITNAPIIVVDLAAELLDVTPETLYALSPTELLEVLAAWWELNDLSHFFKIVWSKMKPLLQTTQLGFNAGSRSHTPSE